MVDGVEERKELATLSLLAQLLEYRPGWKVCQRGSNLPFCCFIVQLLNINQGGRCGGDEGACHFVPS